MRYKTRKWRNSELEKEFKDEFVDWFIVFIGFLFAGTVGLLLWYFLTNFIV